MDRKSTGRVYAGGKDTEGVGVSLIVPEEERGCA